MEVILNLKHVNIFDDYRHNCDVHTFSFRSEDKTTKYFDLFNSL